MDVPCVNIDCNTGQNLNIPSLSFASKIQKYWRLLSPKRGNVHNYSHVQMFTWQVWNRHCTNKLIVNHLKTMRRWKAAWHSISKHMAIRIGVSRLICSFDPKSSSESAKYKLSLKQASKHNPAFTSATKFKREPCNAIVKFLLKHMLWRINSTLSKTKQTKKHRWNCC